MSADTRQRVMHGDATSMVLRHGDWRM